MTRGILATMAKENAINSEDVQDCVHAVGKLEAYAQRYAVEIGLHGEDAVHFGKKAVEPLRDLLEVFLSAEEDDEPDSLPAPALAVVPKGSS